MICFSYVDHWPDSELLIFCWFCLFLSVCRHALMTLPCSLGSELWILSLCFFISPSKQSVMSCERVSIILSLHSELRITASLFTILLLSEFYRFCARRMLASQRNRHVSYANNAPLLEPQYGFQLKGSVQEARAPCRALNIATKVVGWNSTHLLNRCNSFSIYHFIATYVHPRAPY